LLQLDTNVCADTDTDLHDVKALVFVPADAATRDTVHNDAYSAAAVSTLSNIIITSSSSSNRMNKSNK